ncbi:MAG: HupE/UreJ family protein [Gammaproteobacteria bacterium]|nr:HupE/UreJ family protein [Gammaproteobacteria bacterium]
MLLTILVVGTIGNMNPAFGHALQPGYLELQLVEKELYEVIWKTPAVGERPMAITARLPENCETRFPAPAIFDGSAYISRWSTKCAGGLEGGVIQIDGLQKTATDVLVRFELTDGSSEARRLTPNSPSLLVPAQPSPFEVVQTYLLLGIDHILFGVDHLLFVLALLLLVQGLRSVITTITAFTLAHSLTLIAATLGFVHTPVPPTEVVIALSIAFVAAEVVNNHRRDHGLERRYPWRIAFAFGLLHGLGFAGALADIGLPQNSIPTALLFFNIGIEAGQLLFVTSVLACVFLFQRMSLRIKLPTVEWAWAVPPYAIGSLAIYWVIERMAAF